MGEVRPQEAEGFRRHNRLCLSLRIERRFFNCILLGFPKSIEELFEKRNGNGEKLPLLLSVRYRAQVCRDDVSRDRLILCYNFHIIEVSFELNYYLQFNRMVNHHRAIRSC